MPVPSFVTSLGSATGTAVPCTPGAELWVTPGSSVALTAWINGGFCPETGVVNVGSRVMPSGGSIGSLQFMFNGQNGTYWSGATLFQDTRPVATIGDSGGGGGGTVTGELTVQPFEYTPEQQSEIYSAMVLVFGAFLGALALAWSYKMIARIFNWHGHAGD